VIVLSNYDPPSAEEVGRAVRTTLGMGGPRRRKAGAEGPGEVMIGAPVQIAMDLSRHVPVIEAKVNGKGPFRFAVDSGFGAAMEVSPALAQKLALPVVGEAIGGDPSGKNQRKMRMFHVESVDIGEVHFGQVDAGEQSEPRNNDDVDGIIGLQLFSSLIVTFDYPNARFGVDGGSLPAADGARILTYDTAHGVPNVEIDVAGVKVKADIDSGSPSLVSIPLSIAKSLPLAEEPRVVGHGRTPSNEFDVYAAPLNGEVHVGAITLINPRLDFVDIFPVGNLGFRFLKDLVVTFDPANHRVRFVKS